MLTNFWIADGYKEMELLDREIEKLKIERRQLEFHVERTGTENLAKVCNQWYWAE